MNFKCPHRVGKIDELSFIGITKNNSINCQSASGVDADDANEILHEGCGFNLDVHSTNLELSDPNYRFFYADKYQDFADKFNDLCENKHECAVPLDDIEDWFLPMCKTELNERKKNSGLFGQKDKTLKPNIIAVATCKLDSVDVSVGFRGEIYAARTIKKGHFSVFLVLLDFLIVLLLIWFYNRLDEQQKAFHEKFETETIEMTDFTIMLENLPADAFFHGDENIMRARLWNQIENILQNEAIEQNPNMQHVFESTKFEVSDITFARSTTSEASALDKYQKKKKELVRARHRRDLLRDDQ